MSEYSVCFRNGMSGNCNPLCEDFLDGDCDSPEMFEIEDIISELEPDDVIAVFKYYPDIDGFR